MRRWLRKSKEGLQQLSQSIAFLPSLILIGFIFLAIGMLELEASWIDDFLAQNFSWVQIDSYDTASSILGTLTGGVISLTVFSFSMVMVVLNQASSTFSPRLLPGLISNMSHQSVLGIYLGTIVYDLILMFNIRDIDNNYEIPSLGVLGAVLLMGLCMFLFIFFIHNISRSLQIESILGSLYYQTHDYLKNLKIRQTELPAPVEILHFSLEAPTSGYLQEVLAAHLIRLCQSHDIILALEVVQGDFILSGMPLCRINQDLSDKPDLVDQIQNHFVFFEGQLIKNNYIFGFRQLSEIAIKALSPGINDPATAISVLDHFGILMREYLQVPEYQSLVDQKNCIRLVIRHMTLDELLHRIVQPILFYGQQDVSVLERLLWLSQTLLSACETETQQTTVQEFGNIVVAYARDSVKQSSDRIWLNRQIKLLNENCNPEKGLNFI